MEQIIEKIQLVRTELNNKKENRQPFNFMDDIEKLKTILSNIRQNNAEEYNNYVLNESFYDFDKP